MPTRPRIITVSLNPAIDRTVEVRDFALGKHQNAREIARIPGGKAINVSRVLSKLSIFSVATGFLGQDNRRIFQQLTDGPRIRDEFICLPGETRVNTTITDPVRNLDTHLKYPGLEISSDVLAQLEEKLHALAGPDSAVVFSGSAPPGIAPQQHCRLVRRCAEAGSRVLVDTSGPALRQLSDQPMWVIKPNLAELQELAGRELRGEAERFEFARGLTRHIDHVLLSLGSEGACLFTPQLALHAAVGIPLSEVVNTVGCGDALLAGFLAGLWRAAPVKEAFSDAVALASAAACTATSAEFHPDTYSKLRTRVALTAL
ncbi:MAG: 1-phosphofructokinase family hexose kinase [Phycisphaerae bacterium]